MEIYKDLKNPASQEFEKLLNSQLIKNEFLYKLKSQQNRIFIQQLKNKI